MRENPEFKRLSQEIQEKVCSGKTTEEQLNELTKCMEDIKDEMGEVCLIQTHLLKQSNFYVKSSQA